MAIEAKPVHFTEAIDYFRQKINLPTKAWADLWQAQHARAFVVAGATKDALLADLRAAVDKALSQGTTLAEFRKDFDKAVSTHGWDYKGGRNWRSAVIFNTNLRMAYSAGRWDQAQRLKAERPYGRYVHTPSSHERKEHASWHGTILPLDDPWFGTHWGPNGWGCKCIVQTLSDADLKRNGFSVLPQAPKVDWETRSINTPTGPVNVQTPKGIDPGFGYNVGEAAMGRGAERVALESHGKWQGLEAPGTQPPTDLVKPVKPVATLGKPVTKGDETGLRQALRQALGGDHVVLTDPIGGRVSLGQAIVDHMLADLKRHDGREAFFPLIPELVMNPAEIWIGFAKSEVSGRVSIRRRYVTLLDLGKGRTVSLVADADGGQWSGLTFIPGRDLRRAKTLRSGIRLFSRD